MIGESEYCFAEKKQMENDDKMIDHMSKKLKIDKLN